MKEYSEMNADDPRGLFLAGTILFIEDLENDEEKKIQKKLINYCGGIYLSQIISKTTHIIINILKQKNNYKNDPLDYSSPPYIVDCNWLRESFKQSKRLEESYFKPALGPARQGINGLEANSLTSNSRLFNGINFAIDENTFVPDDVRKLQNNIKEHGGKLVSLKIKNHNAKYLIVGDGSKGYKYFNVDPDANGKFVVSSRWLDKCIRENKIINIFKYKLLDLALFPHQVPYKCCKNMRIYFTGFESDWDKYTYERIIKTINAKLAKRLEDATHLIAEKYDKDLFEKASKIEGLKSVSFEWFITLLHEGNPPNEELFPLPEPDK